MYQLKQFKLSVIAFGVGMCFAGVATAQSADGSIFGHAKVKEKISILNLENGAARNIVSENDGAFSFSKLPPGRYRVTSGGVNREVLVVLGTGTEVKFDDGQTVTINASRSRNPIDVSSVESNVVFTLAEIQRLPVGRDATSIALLAPGTVKGDISFGHLASFGGASVAENGYYVNGFDVTNAHKFISYASLPFDAISQEQVKTGGYGAEFGRSLGGVVNISTKRGTNEWRAGGSVVLNPGRLQAKGRDIKNLDPLANRDYQSYYRFESHNISNTVNYDVYAGGPIIKDKLFVFGLIDGKKNSGNNYWGDGSSHWANTTPNGIMKIDWQISDNHRMEFTGISNKDKSTTTVYDNTKVTEKYALRHLGIGRESTYTSGGNVLIGKYTGYLTDNLTLTAQVGRVYNVTGTYTVTGDTNEGADCPGVYDSNGPIGCWNRNHFYIRDPKVPENTDTRAARRFDVEYTLGSHTLRGGFDGQKFTSSNAGSVYSGGIYYRYYRADNTGSVNGVRGVVAPDAEFVRSRIFLNSSGLFSVENNAMYIEDNWKATKNLMLYGGLRTESFDNKNSDGISFVKKDKLLAPRLGASWDVNGDASFKVYGNIGRYFIPVASNTNIRTSSFEYDERHFYTFSGKDPRTQAPLNLGPEVGIAQIVGRKTAPDPGTIADSNLRPMNQDEFILGFQKAIAKDVIFGAKAVYRVANDGMDDYCASKGIASWAKDNGYKDFNPNTLATCILMNPGRPLNLQIDAKNDGKLVSVTVPNSYLGLTKYSRTYKALELSLDRPFDGKWALNGSFVYSVNKGTAEGYVQSDLGQDDAGLTQDFDFGSFTDGAYGPLPNDRTHQLKFYGVYSLTDRFRVGGNLLIASGRKTSCIGYVPETVSDYYGASGTTVGGSGGYTYASSYYCLNDKGESVLGHRGNGPTTPSTMQLDANVTYTLPLDNGHSVTLQMDIFNFFNSRTLTMYNQYRDYSRSTTAMGNGKLNPNYGAAYQNLQGRSVRLTARYEF